MNKLSLVLTTPRVLRIEEALPSSIATTTRSVLPQDSRPFHRLRLIARVSCLRMPWEVPCFETLTFAESPSPLHRKECVLHLPNESTRTIAFASCRQVRLLHFPGINFCRAFITVLQRSLYAMASLLACPPGLIRPLFRAAKGFDTRAFVENNCSFSTSSITTQSHWALTATGLSPARFMSVAGCTYRGERVLSPGEYVSTR